MDLEGALYAGPSGPAADPRVRAFADQALVEIRTAACSDTNLLSDKEAFSEYMYRLNESALLGLNNPPSVATTANFDQNSSDDRRRETSSEGQRGGVTNKTPQTNGKGYFRCVPSIVSPVPAGSSLKMKRYDGDGARAAGAVLQVDPPFRRDGDGIKTVRFNIDHSGDHRSSERTQPNASTRDQVGVSEESSDCGSTEASDDESLSSCTALKGRDLLEELRRWRRRALNDIEGRVNISRQSSRVPQRSQLPPPSQSPQSLPTTPHPASSTPPLSSNPRRIKSRTQKKYRGDSTTAVPGAFPPAPPPSQPMEESRSCGRREPSSLEATGAITTGNINGDKRCGEAKHDDMAATSFRLARGREENTPAAGAIDTTEPKGYVTRPVPCHVGERGRVGGVHGDDEGSDGEDESCGEVSLDLSNCSEEKLDHLFETGRRRGGGQAW